MNLEERELLFDSITKYLTSSYSYYDFRIDGKISIDNVSKMYKDTCDLGWSAFLFSENLGGYGGSAIDIADFFEKFGKYRVISPYLETQITAGTVLSEIGGQGSSNLEELMAGDTIFCVLESSDRYLDSGYYSFNLNVDEVLCGDLGVHPWLPIADKVLMFINDNKEDYLVMMDRNNYSFIVDSMIGVDGSSVGRGRLDKFPASEYEILAKGSVVSRAKRLARLKTIVALCAEAVGAMDTLLWETVEYTRTRKQFGKSISSFQVLQHMMADMFIAQTTSSEMLKGISSEILCDSDYLSLEREILLLKHKINKESKFVRHSAMQCHGGIATTDELMVGHYFKRLVVIDNYFGGPHADLDRIVCRG